MTQSSNKAIDEVKQIRAALSRETQPVDPFSNSSFSSASHSKPLNIPAEDNQRSAKYAYLNEAFGSLFSQADAKMKIEKLVILASICPEQEKKINELAEEMRSFLAEQEKNAPRDK